MMWKFIARRGEGVHHIAYGVEDVSLALEELRAQGVKLLWCVERARV